MTDYIRVSTRLSKYKFVLLVLLPRSSLTFDSNILFNYYVKANIKQPLCSPPPTLMLQRGREPHRRLDAQQTAAPVIDTPRHSRAMALSTKWASARPLRASTSSKLALDTNKIIISLLTIAYSHDFYAMPGTNMPGRGGRGGARGARGGRGGTMGGVAGRREVNML